MNLDFRFALATSLVLFGITVSGAEDVADAPRALQHPEAFVPTHSVPLPAYTPLERGSPAAKTLVTKFRSRLRKVVGWPARKIIHLYPPSDAPHLRYLQDQLERNNLEPMLELGKTPEGEGRIYAYVMEATPQMSDIFGHFGISKMRWCILEVLAEYPGHARINVLSYLQTNHLNLLHARPRLIDSLGRYTFPLAEVLRQDPHPG